MEGDEVQASSINRRSEPRSMMSRSATVCVPGRAAKLACRVTDLSPRGARIKVTAWRMLPDVFELQLSDGPAYRVEACSRRAGVIGVRFLGPA